MAALAVVSGMAGGVSAAGPAVTSTPDDVAFRQHQQWGLVQAGFPAAWCRSTGAGALIVVIDTGVDASHPDLASKVVGQARVQNGVVSSGPGTALDDSGHGTHVAGIAAAATDNRIGVAGAAPGASVYAIKVLFAGAPGQPEQGSQSDLVQAIDFAADTVAPAWRGPVVLNISIGAADPSSGGTAVFDGSADIPGALEHAYSRGLAVALAAGNAGTTPVGGSAVEDGHALSVGALDQNGAVAPYSPTAGVSVFAAGGAASGDRRYVSTGIISTWPHSSSGDYAWMAGTSMAAPHVAAALALLMSSGLSNAQAYARLLGTADAQRRMHVDLALGNTAPCGGVPVRGAAGAGGAGAAPPAGGAVRVARPAPPPVAAASAVAAPVAARHVAAVPVSAEAAVTAARPGAWVPRVVVVVCGVLLLMLVMPRRRLLGRLLRA